MLSRILGRKRGAILGRLRPLLLFATYLCVGVVFYTNMETKACAGPDLPALDPNRGSHSDSEVTVESGSGPCGTLPPVAVERDCKASWTGVDAVYFAVVTMSTVGYGDLSPSTWYSQLFTVFYIFIGVLAVFSQLTATVVNLFTPAFALSRKVLTFVLPQPALFDVDGKGGDDVSLPQSPATYYTTRLMGPVLVVLVLQLLFAGAFSAIEPDWGYGLAIYHCLVTATTVGYGDVSITTDGGKVCAVVHILVSVCALGAIVGDIDAARKERAAQLFRAEQLMQKFDRANLENLLMRLDQDGGGVEKFEFVVGMLLEAASATLSNDQRRRGVQSDVQSAVDVYLKLFERADMTGDGKLSSADIEQLTAEFDKMWPSHSKVVRVSLIRQSTVKLGRTRSNSADPAEHGQQRGISKEATTVKYLAAKRRNRVAVAPLPSETSNSWCRAAAQVQASLAQRHNQAAVLAASSRSRPAVVLEAGAKSSSARKVCREFSSPMEPADSQRSFVEQGGARSRVSP